MDLDVDSMPYWALMHIFTHLQIKDIYRLLSTNRYYRELWKNNKIDIIFRFLSCRQYMRVQGPVSDTRTFHFIKVKGPNDRNSRFLIQWAEAEDKNKPKTEKSGPEAPLPEIGDNSYILTYKFADNCRISCNFDTAGRLTGIYVTSNKASYVLVWQSDTLTIKPEDYTSSPDPTYLINYMYSSIFPKIEARAPVKLCPLPEKIQFTGKTITDYYNHITELVN